jgi:DNA-binding transcriptional MocR family regulator
MRLNFSYSDEKTIREGVQRLGEVIKEELNGFQRESYPPNGV